MDCLITSRGATRAKAMAETLRASGLPARLTMAPPEAALHGCAHAVALPEGFVGSAERALRSFGAYRVFCPDGTGGYRERKGR